MTTTQDWSIGYGIESTFKTGVTPTRFVEGINETFDWKKGTKQGQGIRVGSRVDRAGRRVNPSGQGSGGLDLEVASKGLGLLWELLFGNSVSTLVGGSTYQQVHTFGDSLSSATFQKGIPDANLAVQPITFLGCVCSDFEIDFANDGILGLKPNFDIADISTAPTYSVPSYPAEPVNLLHFQNATIYSGTLTPQTTTALASAATPLGYVRGGTLKVNNNLQNARFNAGGGGRKAVQLVGKRDVTATLDVELTGNALINAVINDTPMSIVWTYTAGTLSTGVETLQLVMPACFPDSELPKSNGTNLVVPAMQFTSLDDLTHTPLAAIVRTSDAAL